MLTKRSMPTHEQKKQDKERRKVDKKGNDAGAKLNQPLSIVLLLLLFIIIYLTPELVETKTKLKAE